MEDESDNLAKILRMFKTYNCHEETLLTRDQLSKILNKQAQRFLNRDFSPLIIRQIWGQAETNSRGESTMRTFAKIINNAIDILESRLYRIHNDEIGIPHFQTELRQTNSKLNHLETEYESGYLENYEKINIERKNKVILENKIKQLEEQEVQFKRDLEQIKTCMNSAPEPQSVASYEPRIDRSQVLRQMPEPDNSYSFEKRPNPVLLLLFQLTVAGVILQMFALTVKPSLLALVTYFLVFFWLFLGYFDRMFVTYLIGGLAASSLFDFIYMLLQFTGSINTTNPVGNGVIVLTIVFLFVEIALRIIMIIKMLPFRVPTKKEEYFVLMGQEIELKLRAGKRQTLKQEERQFYRPSV